MAGSKKPVTFKILVIGDSSVGKSCLTVRFAENRFPVYQKNTVGLDFKAKTVLVDNEPIRLYVWDTAGQEIFWSGLAPQYYRDASAIVFVYDLTRLDSFKNLYFWLNECKANDVCIEKIPCVLVGNKRDLISQAAVTYDMGKQFAKKHGMPFFETSAFSDDEYDNVASIFLILAHQLKERKDLLALPDVSKIRVMDEPMRRSPQKKKCCVII